ncbi:conserved Plasmodium protein, unknown function [Plasmodium knowlesi strain H]|uniref:Uncharacterized protein n=3 Tax=Plasmodium knowlesi TaxID=5850 RepID=A0A5K1U3I1_PLAKH|nr:conserved Plasmodium protein, unknown function [Plasmodium knowlesi strain H]OTN68639.1 Uncharacterized protein PKNOH_S01018200 [Plasmodium knowlesi]CAA9986179.1 conserved Plasmodium protein, unknown function [Plasmodium knowlesi strain H]SBO25377.1 conserved Plasmodium protein, unknown function [Plasmodium knowlesi strain H]SBO27673.1 conserved Plasmodium protein, unknown function [Plasmodium knowlesi strain H]VVS75653.1 conserved Plasmodium protein, unknown function [Plasmodium knowlesi s|eukprot:XP_002257590.1 hypothetical protein, conserved in Plasmodium species [Plasmodium knowlesi strain H]
MAVLSRRPLVHLEKAKRIWVVQNGFGKRRFAQLGGGNSQHGGANPPASSNQHGGSDYAVSGIKHGIGDYPISTSKQRERTKMNDFHYFNIFLLEGSDLVKLTSKYNFCENKNMYACILLHLSSVYNSIPVRDIVKVLKNILEQNKASFSHHLVKGKKIIDLYKHLCNHLEKLNTAQVIDLLTCACYTTQEFPVKSIQLLCRVILSKPMSSFHPRQIHEICSCLIKMKNEFSMRKITYDDTLHVKMVEHVKGRIVASDAQAFFEYLPLYVNLSKGMPPSDCTTQNNVTPEYGFVASSHERNLRKTSELIFFNHLSELNRESLLAAVTILKWLNIGNHSIFFHMCDAFVKHTFKLETKYVVRFWRKCHSLRFEKGEQKGHVDGGKESISSDETLRRVKGGVNNPGEEKPMDYPGTVKTGEILSEGKSVKGEEEEGSNVLLSYINRKVYHMTPPELALITHGLYSFVENMKQYSQLSTLRNNMNLLFSMAVQYVLNYLDRGALHQDGFPPNGTIRNGTTDLPLTSRGDEPTNINMNTDYVYISESGIHVSRGNRDEIHLPSDNCSGDNLPLSDSPQGGPSSRRVNLTHACDILLNISYLNTSQNHRKIKDAYDCVKKIITQENSSVQLDHLLSLLLCLSNFYHRTRDNYVFHSYKQILHMLEMRKPQFNAHHFNKLSVAITPLLQEKNNLIDSYAHLVCFFIENEVVPLRSCVFTLQHVMKKICIKLSDPLVKLLLVIIRRMEKFLSDVRAHITRNSADNVGYQGNRDDLHDNDSPDSCANREALRQFLLLHSINESTLTCVLVSLSLILQNAKYGTGARDEAAALLCRVVSYVSTASLEKIPKKYIHAGLLDALPPDDNRVKKVLLSRV